MIPPVGSIIIGPCPQCQELVVVFCGQVLPLNTEIMTDGALEARQDHLLAVLTEFLSDRIRTLMTDEHTLAEQFSDPQADSAAMADADDEAAQPAKPEVEVISQTELDKFIEVDLKLLDNKAYFESIFNGK